MKRTVISFLLLLALAMPGAAQERIPDDPLLDDPLLNDPLLDEPVIDESNLDDPVIDDPAVADPGTRVEDLPLYRRMPTDRALTTEEIFEIIDSDGNGVIDQAEWRQQMMVVFFVRDANEDTQLTRDEVPGMTDETFRKTDLNGDGIISGYEFNQSEFNDFFAADANGDGKVTLQEFEEFLSQFE